jgi:hypothetical protein
MIHKLIKIQQFTKDGLELIQTLQKQGCNYAILDEMKSILNFAKDRKFEFCSIKIRFFLKHWEHFYEMPWRTEQINSLFEGIKLLLNTIKLYELEDDFSFPF